MWDLAIEPPPDGNGYIFRRRNRCPKLRNLKVQVAMIVNSHHLTLKNIFQFFQVHHKAGNRIDFSRHCNFQRVVMPMPIAVGTFAEHTRILFRG